MPASCAPRRGHVAPTGWMRRWRRSCRRSRAAVTACVQIGHKGRLAFFRPATEPRNHAVSFRPFQSGKALCIQFGHRPALEDCLVTARRRIPMRNPAPTGPRHLTSLSWVAGPPAGLVLRCTVGDIPRGWVRSALGGGIRRRRGQESGPRTREMPPAGRKSHRPRRMSPSAAGPGRHAHVGRPARQLGPARKGRHRARLRG